MSQNEQASCSTETQAEPHVLRIEATLAATPAAIWRCWTEPELLKQWYCPKPYYVSEAVVDVRVGGSSFIRMQGPDGWSQDCPGMYLEVVPQKRLVMTDAFRGTGRAGALDTGSPQAMPWLPSAKAFTVITVELTPLPEGRTHYTASAYHWNEADKQAHEQMGFHEGWGVCTQQLEALAKTLPA